ncbi:hypothetical protein EDL79_03120 [Ehrlichia ruminantium]|uniref:Uncharacterized protein n=1 Tax=Ehrlichia ruminantium TaxID=779 RepID=A0AAE6QAY9_EHRRU|nr:hypothetical protein [Ehrlichia ruminantium]QGR02623.1 hypothetical protein EDL81_03110 [Ehrlichia ruminantium]QGR03543.1 hypothetical protein EDL80_03110 [Ehrlichia ruminantium]QGR04470.1 hypothetical protein EDL79_03120 [Ehrlichia ruminantium]
MLSSLKRKPLSRSLSFRHKDHSILQEEEEELRGASGRADPTKPTKGKFAIPQVSITKLTSPKKKSYGTGQPQKPQFHGITNLSYDEGASGRADPTKSGTPSTILYNFFCYVLNLYSLYYFLLLDFR